MPIQVTHINIAPSGTTSHGHQYGVGMQHRPLTSAQPSVVSQAKDINTNPGHSKIMHLDTALRGSMDLDIIASGGSTGHSHQHGPSPWKHNVQTLGWPQGAAPEQEHLNGLHMESEVRDISMAPDCKKKMGMHMNLYMAWGSGPQIPTWLLGAAQTVEIFQEGPVQNMDHSSSWTSYRCSEPG